MGKVVINADDLAKSAVKFRPELLAMSVIGLENTKKHMTIRPGIRYKEIVGELSGNLEVGPYSETRIDETDVNVTKRELETFLGSVVKPFSPNSVYSSIYGSSITKGDALKDTNITKMVLAYLMKQVAKSLNNAIWSAERNAAGTKTIELFNGFDTITKNEIAGKNMSAEKGNLMVFSEKIDKTNAVDALKEFYRTADPVLQEENTKLFLTPEIYDAYVDDYQSTVGAVIYNTEFEKRVLEGSDGKCELVKLANKAGSNYIHLSTQSNMLIGVDQESDLESITVEKHAAFVLQFIATLFFGVQFESISKERLLVGQLFTA
jgi:hypothetical protein